MAKKIGIKNPSVLNSTIESSSRSNREKVPDTTPPPAASRESDSSEKASKSADSAPPPLKTSNSLNVEATTTTARDPRIPIPSSSSQSPVPQPLDPCQQFAVGLATAFQNARKPSPTEKQAAEAYRLISYDWEGFLRWLPTSPAFPGTKTPGGLKTLIQFYRGKEVKINPQTSPLTWANESCWLVDRLIWKDIHEANRQRWKDLFRELGILDQFDERHPERFSIDQAITLGGIA